MSVCRRGSKRDDTLQWWRSRQDLQCRCWLILFCRCCWKLHLEHGVCKWPEKVLDWLDLRPWSFSVLGSVIGFWGHWTDNIWQCQAICQLCIRCWCLQSQISEVNAEALWLQLHYIWQVWQHSTRASWLDWHLVHQQEVLGQEWLAQARVHRSSVCLLCSPWRCGNWLRAESLERLHKKHIHLVSLSMPV